MSQHDDSDYADRLTGRSDLSFRSVVRILPAAVAGGVFGWLFRRRNYRGEPSRRTFRAWARARWDRSFLNGSVQFWWWLRRTRGYENAE